MDTSSSSCSSSSSSSPEKRPVAGKRKRKTQNQPLNQWITSTTRKWSTVEKQRLLSVVKAVGYNDLDELAKYFGQKDKEQISSYLRSRESFGKLMIKDKKADSGSSFENWYNFISLLMLKQENLSQIIGEAVGEISETEFEFNSGPKRTSKKPDALELYQYLQSLLSQQISPTMRSINQKILSYLIDMLWRLVEAVGPSLQDEIEVLLQLVQESSLRPKNDVDEDEEEEEENSDVNFKLLLNPISIPNEILESIFEKLTKNPAFEEEIERFVFMCLSLNMIGK